MSTYVKLQEQIEALQAEAAKVREAEKAQKLAQVKENQGLRLTPQEVLGRRGRPRARKATSKKAAAASSGEAKSFFAQVASSS